MSEKKKSLETPGMAAKTSGAPVVASPFLAMFRFSTPLDVLLMVVSHVCACGHGVTLPLFCLLFGSVINGLNSSDLSATVPDLCLRIMGLAVGAGVGAYFQNALHNLSAVRQVQVLRSAYIRALFRQDIAWCDAHSAGEECARLTEDTLAVEDGIGSKLPLITQSLSTFFAGLILAFTISWKMSLVLLGFLPFLGGVMALISSSVLGSDDKSADAYGDAGEVATEALHNIRTVAAFGGESILAKRYDEALGRAERAGVKKSTLTGLTFGVFLCTLFVVYGTCLLWGAQLVIWSRQDNPACAFNPTIAGCVTGGTVMQVVFALITAAGGLGQMAPSFTALTSARAATARIHAIIDRIPVIDTAVKEGSASSPSSTSSSSSSSSSSSPSLRGRIEFRDVTFAYPSRPEVNVLTNFSLVVEPGQHFALVGPSGCGKSTLIALIQRWYDVQGGAVLVDGVDVRTVGVQTLRGSQALVSQESFLLAGSVAKILSLGAVGLEGVVVAPEREALEVAARLANAHDFIMALPQGYDTPLTNTSLSGGQRQRLCIARALLRSSAPILLLDEASSALDTTSEKMVQASIDALISSSSSKRTTVTIAHRLSTIDGADVVCVMSSGSVIERGSPKELMGKVGGVFKAMREAQVLTPTTSALPSAPSSSTALSAGVAGSSNVDIRPSTAASSMVPLVETSGLEVGKKDLAKPSSVSFFRVAGYNAPEAIWAVVGIVTCCITGATMPGFALLLSRFINIYFDPDSNALWTNALFYMGMFFLIGGANFFACILQQYAFGLMGERLVRRVRSAAFSAILRFEISWHDAHSPGAVAAGLGSDAYLLRSATGPSLALSIQNIVGLLAGLIIAFTASWRITLVVLCIAPLIAVGGMLHLKMMVGSNEESKKAFAESGAIATEALSAPRTIAAYGLQAVSLSEFTAALEKPTRANKAAAWTSGIGMSLMATIMIGSYALIFGVGSIFISQGVLTFQSLLTALFGVMFAAMGMGNSGGLAVDSAKAAAATDSLFSLIDRKPAISTVGEAGFDGSSVPPSGEGCTVTLQNVSLSYPGRPLPALNGVDIHIPSGTFCALVGASGCGKSSIVSLLLRFYEPSKGAVLLNGKDINSLPLSVSRASMAWVQQEPSLFNSSVAFNIGFPGVSEETPTLITSAKSAGAHDFIAALPEGYKTLCGTRGSQLSGGQKQRLCIARALMKNAPLLLLDEATSALDTSSEAQIQASVDALLAAKREGGGSTVLVIAHRLSTIKSADLVLVMDQGRVVESGTWATLSGKEGGLFASMLKVQGVISV